ncbi:TraY domain-containing protein [Cupriavidus taiwanensis]|uniref:type II toxin-antitoxin system RelB family antitoxin n=1 Tax=Cupriavidus taiwanensis TaxID=164546 RepID=UPI002540CAD4|nr:TraY domain-containing protein [Cupriavidus taiwanensis]MDK3023329.1 TraY domain-containing protein [Cupriavidus taiwanensis]
MEATLIVLRLPKQIEQRLKALARRTGRSETFYACQAIIRHLDDLEDLHLAHTWSSVDYAMVKNQR